MKKCCIIGGGGFLGTSLTSLLVETGRKVTVIDKKPRRPEFSSKITEYIEGDFTDVSLLRKILPVHDEIIHLAYTSTPSSSFDSSTSDILNNLVPTINLMDVACETELSKFILVSSGGTVYGRTKKEPIMEDHPTDPISPYGITKLACEKYGMMYHHLRGLPIICVRPSNAYGEGQLAFTGQGFVATAIASIIRGEDVIVYGEEGTTRDYIHILDLSAGIRSALDHGHPYSCFNIGTGVGLSNIEVLRMIKPLAEESNLRISLKKLPERRFDVPHNVLDCTKLQDQTGWRTTIPVREGIARTWQFFVETMGR